MGVQPKRRNSGFLQLLINDCISMHSGGGVRFNQWMGFRRDLNRFAGRTS